MDGRVERMKAGAGGFAVRPRAHVCATACSASSVFRKSPRFMEAD